MIKVTRFIGQFIAYALFALVVGFGLAFIVDALDPSVKTAREAERIFEAPVIASVARIGRK